MYRGEDNQRKPAIHFAAANHMSAPRTVRCATPDIRKSPSLRKGIFLLWLNRKLPSPQLMQGQECVKLIRHFCGTTRLDTINCAHSAHTQLRCAGFDNGAPLRRPYCLIKGSVCTRKAIRIASLHRFPPTAALCGIFTMLLFFFIALLSQSLSCNSPAVKYDF